MKKVVKRPHVLVVEDTEENIDILMETLSDDFSVSVALDGAIALKLVDKQKPDLILLDIQMPVMDGYEACRRLKANPETASIPVIFLTAMTEDGDESLGLGMGAVDYIHKPYNPSLVKARVKNQIELKRYKDNLEKLVEERTVELHEANEKLKLIDATKNDFLGAISHGLRTPVNGVLGVAQLAIDNVCDQNVRKELSTLFEIGNLRLVETVENSLLLAQVQSSGYEVKCERLDLKDVFDQVCAKGSPKISQKGINVSSEIPGPLYVMGNTQLLLQVVRTALRMGVNMAKEGTDVHVSVAEDGEMSGLLIVSEGRHYSDELLETAFDTFSYKRASSYLSDLGLATPLAHKIVLMLNGELRLLNLEGNRTGVALFLPRG